MGVKDLWKLLEPTGRPVTLESLEGMVLAVDVSIWLNQAVKGMRDRHGNPVPQAHLVVLFSRICKLLHYHIKPVFVFDGATPLLKKKTLAERYQKREHATQRSLKAADKQVTKFLQAKILEHVYGEQSSVPTPQPSQPEGLAPVVDMFELPPLPDNTLDKEMRPDDESSSVHPSTLAAHQHDVTSLDIQSEDFHSLPLEVQHELLLERQQLQKHSHHDPSALPQVAGDFSNYQLSKLMSQSRTSQKLEQVRGILKSNETAAMGLDGEANIHTVETSRIHSSENAHYILVHGRDIDSQSSQDEDTLEEWSGGYKQEEKEVNDEILVRAEKSRNSISDDVIDNTDVSNTLRTETHLPSSTQKSLLTHSSKSHVIKHALESRNRMEFSNSNQHFMSKELDSVLIENEDITGTISDEELEANVETVNASLKLESAHTGTQAPTQPPTLQVQPVTETPIQEKRKHLGFPEDPLTSFKDQPPSVALSSKEPPPQSASLSIEEHPPQSAPPSTEEHPPQFASLSTEEHPPQCVAVSTEETAPQRSSLTTKEPPPQCVVVSDKEGSPEGVWEEVDGLLTLPPSEAQGVLRAEIMELEREKARQTRAAAAVSNQMYKESQELLTLFGLPFMVAPSEAEAQCACLNVTGLTQGTITDDNDIFLFGGKRVYRSFFSQDKEPEVFNSSDIQTRLGLTRDQLIVLAYLLGSDYTPGLEGVGIVSAMELLRDFSGDGIEPLKKLRGWHEEAVVKPVLAKKANGVLRKLSQTQLPGNFPDETVYQAYLSPEVDSSSEQFEWGRPDLDLLRKFAQDKIGWDQIKVDSILLPVLKRMNAHQKPLTHYLPKALPNVSPQKKKIKSRRIRNVVARLTNREPSQSTKRECDSPPSQPSKQRRVTRKTSRQEKKTNVAEKVTLKTTCISASSSDSES